MTNYHEEQAMELEALQAIYADDFEELASDPKSFRISIASEGVDEDEQISLVLQLTYSPTYPDELPIMDIETDDLEPSQIEALREMLVDQGNQSLGTVMVYTLVSAAKEWTDNIGITARQERESAARAIIEQEKQAEQRKFHGTPVTIDTFKAWKAAFDKEMADVAAKAGVKIDTKKTKLFTGRQLFEKDETLKDSDIAAYDEGDVVVDETLFENMGDLDLDADEDGTNIQFGDSDED
eukprot:Opistho-2@46076